MNWKLVWMEVTTDRTVRSYEDETSGIRKTVTELYKYSQYHSHLISAVTVYTNREGEIVEFKE